jgi:hypothetical protein
MAQHRRRPSRTSPRTGRTLRGLIAVTGRRQYLDRRLSVTPEGFVQQHVLVAERSGRPDLRLPACLVCTVANERITRLDEYFDSRALDVWVSPPREEDSVDRTGPNKDRLDAE